MLSRWRSNCVVGSPPHSRKSFASKRLPISRQILAIRKSPPHETASVTTPVRADTWGAYSSAIRASSGKRESSAGYMRACRSYVSFTFARMASRVIRCQSAFSARAKCCTRCVWKSSPIRRVSKHFPFSAILVAGGLRCAESRHGRTAAAGADQAVGSSHDDLHCRSRRLDRRVEPDRPPAGRALGRSRTELIGFFLQGVK